ncbi:hypothetical protein ACLMJK_002251 [Lecanora helva]
MPPFNPPFTITPLSNHTHTLILLHDRDATSQNFGLDILSASTTSGKLLQTLFQGTKFIFPTANQQCVTAIEGGPRMSQWFDVYSTIDPSKRDALQLKGLREGAGHVHEIVDAEASIIPLRDIFLGGFGQGSAMALYALLTYRPENQGDHLGGFVGMSGWLPLSKWLDELTSNAGGEGGEDRGDFNANDQISRCLRNQVALPQVNISPPRLDKIPILLAHGQADAQVPADLAEQATDALTAFGLNVTLKTYEALDHAWRNIHEIDDITGFLADHGMAG